MPCISARGRRGCHLPELSPALRRFAARRTAPPDSGAGSGRSVRRHPRLPAQIRTCASVVRARTAEVETRGLMRLRADNSREAVLSATPAGGAKGRARVSPRAVGCERPQRREFFRHQAACRRANIHVAAIPGWEGGRGCPLRERPQPVRLQGRTVQRAARRSCRRELPKRMPAPD